MTAQNAVAMAISILCCTAAVANPLDQQLMNLEQAQQRKALKMVLAMEKCDAVTNATRDGTDKKDNAFWSVQCADGNSYFLMIRNDKQGSTQVVSCEMALMTKIHRCFTKMEQK